MAKIEVFRHVENGRRYAQGEVIFREGEPGNLMYAVVEGEVEIRIDHAPRSATAIAATPCVLVPIDEKQFQYMVQQTPFFALQVMRVLAERLRRQT